MKKALKLIISFVLLVACIGSSAFAFTMYAPDGRTIDVPETEIQSWQSVGWYTEPVVIIYAPDGRVAVVALSEKELYLNWGWYDIPVQYIYAPDGRCVVVRKSEVEAYVAVGWYTEPVKALYSLNGEVVVLAESVANEYINRGWYDAPVTYMCNNDGQAMLAYQSAKATFEEAGWWELPLLYREKIRQYSRAVAMGMKDFEEKYTDSSSVNKTMITKLIKDSSSVEYTLYDVDKNGVYELVIIGEGKLIDMYTITGNTLVKLYDNCNLGDTYRLHILEDGSLFCEGTNGATTKSYKVHKLNAVGNALVKVKFEYCDSLGKQSYMTGFDFISESDYNKRVKNYLSRSIHSKLIVNPSFN